MSLASHAINRLRDLSGNVLRKNRQLNADRYAQRSPQESATFVGLETMEPRLLLSAAGGQAELLDSAAAVFTANAGQWGSDIHYGLQGDYVGISLKDSGLDFVCYSPAAGMGVTFSVGFDGADLVTPTGLDPAGAAAGVATFGTVVYEDLYPGIDLYTFARPSSLKYEFHVAPGADFDVISISYDGIEGLYVDDAGAMHVRTAIGELVDDTPYIYQVVDGMADGVAGSFRLIDNDTYTFQISGEYDPTVELIIDPYLEWATYLGGNYSAQGSGEDIAQGVVVDSDGDIWVAGYTVSTDFPTTEGAFSDELDGSHDAFLTKYDEDGDVLFSSYFGGDGYDRAFDLAADGSGNVFIVGHTRSSDLDQVYGIPDTLDESLDGVAGQDAFVVKIDSSGDVAWATYFGGNGIEQGWDIAVDSSGSNVFIVGFTESTNLPGAMNVAGETFGGSLTGNEGRDVFLAKFDGSGVLQWSTYVGGSDKEDNDAGVAMDGDYVVVVGQTWSDDFYTTSGLDETFTLNNEAFVRKYDGSGDPEIEWSTYVGGNTAKASAVAIDSNQNIVITGMASNHYPTTTGAFDESWNGLTDAIVTRFDDDGSIEWSTYMGGVYPDYTTDSGVDLVIDSNDDIIVCGRTDSEGFHTTEGVFDRDFGGATTEGFVAKFRGDAVGTLVWSSLLGGAAPEFGSGGDLCMGIALDGDDNVITVGFTDNDGPEEGDFPVRRGHDMDLGGKRDAFVAKINMGVLVGDFNYDSWVNDLDIDLLGAAIRTGSTNWALYDISGDGEDGIPDVEIDFDDLDYLVHKLVETTMTSTLGLYGTEYGDFDLDGDIDTTDLGILATNFGVGTTWAEGDADLDGVIDTTDLAILSTNFGFDRSEE